MSIHDVVHCAPRESARTAAIPMTAAQRGIYYAQQLDPDVPMSVAAFAEFRDEVDVDIMSRAVQTTSYETQSGLLRLVESGDDEPLTTIDPGRSVAVGRRDFSTEADPRAAALAWIDEHRSRPTDLFTDPLLETYLLRLGPRHVIWYCWGHHLAFDGYAAMYMMVRVAQHYTSIVEGTEPAPSQSASLSEIADIDAAYRASTRFDTDRTYWQQRLHTGGDLAENTSLAGRSAAAAPVAAVHSAILDGDVVDRIRAIAAAESVRPASVITAAVALYLARINDRDEAMLSLPVACRDHDILRTSAGLTSNVLPIRVGVGENNRPATRSELVADTNHDIKHALRHQRFRHEDIAAEVLDARSGRRGFFGPMVNVMLFFEHIDFGPLRAELNVLSTGPVEDASINVYDGFTGGMRMDLEVNPHVYSPAEAQTHHRRLVDFLQTFVEAQSDTPVDTLPLAAHTEGYEVFASGDEVELPETTLADLLRDGAQQHPDATGVIDAGTGESLTHSEFAARAEQLAAVLIRRGVGPDQVVGVALHRSVDQFIALHAVIRAGGAFLPIAPDEPARRLQHILHTAAPELIIAGEGWTSPISEIPTMTAADLVGGPLSDDDPSGSDPSDTDMFIARPRPEHAAYVLFTSGSTGDPKGVVISHRAITNRLLWMQNNYGLSVDDRVLHKTPATFDVSVWEFFWPFLTGAAVVVTSPDGHRDPWYLREVIRDFGITTLHFVPSMLSAFAEALADDPETSEYTACIRRIFTSGEALTPAAVSGTASIVSAPIHNLYGPTEAAIDVTHHDDCTAESDVIPIGRPVWNTAALVLDHRLAPQPVGAIGELYLGGVQLARGYSNRSDLTAGRFIAGPNGTRLYRTGDLVRRQPDGSLIYLGRSDSQVKIRGQRVELGEVESALAALDGVLGAAALVRDDIVDGDHILVGYVCGCATARAAELEPGRLRSQLIDRLPAHMVPTDIVVLAALPTTANGKLDRRALPAPQPQAAACVADHVQPTNPIQALVVEEVAAVLGLPEVSTTANFFDLGGNSLSATRVAARISRRTTAENGPTRLSIRDIFDSADLADIAAALTERGITEAEASGTEVSGAEVWGAEVSGAEIPAPTDGPVPLSPAQHRLWLTGRLDPQVAARYNIPFTLRMVGPLDVAALDQALIDVIDRHEPLRSTVADIDGHPHIQVHPEVHSPTLEIISPDGDRPISEHDYAARPFDLESEMPLRARLIRVGRDDHRLTIVIHHIAADGWSLAPLAADLAAAYRARRDNTAPAWEALPTTYSAVSSQRHRWLDGPQAAQELQFWADQLADAPAETALPTDRPRPRDAAPGGDTVSITIPASRFARLREIAADHDATTFMALHAVLATLLRSIGESDTVLIGTPVSGRGTADLDQMVGMFVNTVTLRSQVDKNASFAELLRTIRNDDLQTLDHCELPFDRIVTELNPARSQTVHPFFQVSLSVEDSASIVLDFADLAVTASRIETGHAKFDLQFTATENRTHQSEPSMTIDIGYATALFDRETVVALSQRLLRIIDAVSADTAVAVGDIPMLAPAERLELLPAIGAGRRPPEHFSRLLAAAVAAEPDRIAIQDGRRSLTYRDLDRQANRLARLLLAHGAGPEQFIAVSLPRGVDWIVAVWAITRTGAAWLPVDPDYPADRIDFMLADSTAQLLLTNSVSAPNRGAGSAAVKTLVLDTAESAHRLLCQPESALHADELHTALSVDQPAYLIYTSGTTGTPKGVVVSHRGLADFAAHQAAHFCITSAAHTMHMASPSFDASILEMLMALSAAATLHIVEPGIVGGRELVDVIDDRGITHAFVTPSVLTTMSPEQVPSLRVLVIGGEHPNTEVVRRWAAHMSLFNAYGPTETTIVATVSGRIDPADTSITIGTPIRGMSALVLDERLRPVTPGTVGELYLSGPHLARGYHGIRPLTAKRFIANPFGDPGERMYRTGDLVRWTGEHQLEFRGRADRQTKVRGHRIELGEIDAALAADDAASAAVTVTDGVGDRTRLIAYVTRAKDHLAPLMEMRSRMATILPRHMVPHSIIEIDRIPTTPTGKIDFAALPTPETSGHSGMPPRTPIESAVANLIAGHLAVDPASVSRDDDFFDLGGNSLLATQIVGALENLGGVRLAVRDVFSHPTIAELAALVDGAGGTNGDSCATEYDATGHDAAITALHHDPDTVVSPGPAQHQLWFLNRLATEAPTDTPTDSAAAAAGYTIAFALELDGDLDVDALRAALQHAIERHEPLRTVYPENDGTPTLRIVDAATASPQLPVQEITDEAWSGAAEALARRGFDLTQDTPLRAVLHRITDSSATQPLHRLTVVVHHIAADGWSMEPLARDIGKAYTHLHTNPTHHDAHTSQRDANRTVPQAPLPVTYRDYLRWRAENLGIDPNSPADPRQLDGETRLATLAQWWRDELDGMDHAGILQPDAPTDAPAGAHTVSVPFDPDLVARLRGVGEGKVTEFMAIHAVLAALLRRHHGDPDVHTAGAVADIVVGTPVAGRNDPRLSDLVGMFVNSVVLRTPVAESASFLDILDEVRNRDLEAFTRADMPFEQVVAAVNPPRTQRHPLFRIALAFDAARAEGRRGAADLPDLPGVAVTTLDVDTAASRFDLEVRLRGDRVEFTYATDIFTEARIASLAADFVALAATAAASPHLPIGQYPLPSTHGDINPVAAPAAVRQRHLGELLEDAAARFPEHTAVVEGTQSLSYAQLLHRARRWAYRLQQEGVDTDDAIAIALPRGMDSIIATWAVTLAGAAVLPLDPSYPAVRLLQMVTDSAVRLGISDAPRIPELAELTSDKHPMRWHSVAELEYEPARFDTAPPLAPLRRRHRRLDSTAYVIYTSGSTGKPKGVSVTHRGIAAFAAEQRSRFDVRPGERTLRFSSPSFDASFLELLLAVDSAATMVIAPRDIYGGDELVDFLAEASIAHAFITPAALCTATVRPLPQLRTLAVGGEASPPELVAAWAPGRRYVNCYGPTESTIVATMSDPISAGEEVTIGRSIADTRAAILDHRLNVLPPNTPGELYLSGPGVARGYLHRAGLTASRFVAAPGSPALAGLSPGSTMYRTGDIVHRRVDGTLVYRGRVDTQVKVRGFRIELGEVSAALRSHPAVSFATTVVDGDGGDARLRSYVTLTVEACGTDGADLRSHLGGSLPPHMVPASVAVVDRIPLTPNGKIDRQALLSVQTDTASSVQTDTASSVQTGTASSTAAGVAAEGSAQVTAEIDTFAQSSRTVITEVLADVLGLDAHSLADSDDFFALGGTSLQATTVVSRLAGYGISLRVRDIFDHPSIAALSAQVAPAQVQPARGATATAAELPAQSPPAPEAEPDDGPIPLAPMQRRLWSLARSAPNSAAYLIPVVIRLSGPVDVVALRGAVVDITARHTTLRTVFPVPPVGDDAAPVGTLLDPDDVVGALTPTYIAAGEFDSEVARLCTHAIDPTHEAPIRAYLLSDTAPQAGQDWLGSTNSGEAVLVLTLHHLAADGASLPTLLSDLITAYSERRQGRDRIWSPGHLDYRAYARRAAAASAADSSGLSYWVDMHQDSPPETTVPVTRTDAAATQAAPTAAAVSIPIDDDLQTSVDAWLQQRAATPFAAAHTALIILLHRLGVGDDLVIGTPVTDRSPDWAADGGESLDCSGMVGMFVNSLALRTRVSATETVEDLFTRIRSADLDAMERRDIPFDDIVTALNPTRTPGRHPLFQVALSVHDYGAGLGGSAIDLDGGTRAVIADLDGAVESAAKFDLQFTITGMRPGRETATSPTPSVELTYDSGRYTRAEADKLAARYLRVLRAMVTDADRCVGDIRITDPLEVAAISPASGPAAGPPTTLSTLLDEAVQANPEGIAAICDDEQITYRELDERANRLARVLLGFGLGSTDSTAEPLVAMVIPRSIEAVVATWAVLRAGAAYVPVDPTYPAERIETMLTDSGATLVVTTGAAIERIGEAALLDTPTVQIDAARTLARLQRSAPTALADSERIPPRCDGLAYMIYTSGSTGRPKGVLVPHSGLRAVRDELRIRMSPEIDSRVLHFASPSFDASVLEYLLAAAGASALVIAPTDIYGGTELAEFLARHRVSHAFITPAALATIAPEQVPTLRTLAVGGEAYGSDLVRRWVEDRSLADAPGRTWLNVYGPTETTVIVTSSDPLSAEDELSIGTPNNGVGALVLDARLHPVPAGVPGELYLLGNQVTRGYHERRALTAERYVPVPMVAGIEHAGQRMYRTGDLVRWTVEGRLVYLARNDSQVQLRGFRIELGEVDDALTADPNVDFAVSIVAPTGDAIHSYVRAAVDTTDPTRLDTAAVRRAVAARLPRHMVPSTLTVIEDIPLTPTGKLDRSALPTPEPVTAATRPTRPGVESAIAAAFAEVLGIDAAAVGPDTEFFDLGGDSLLAARLATHLSATLDRQVRVPDIFAAPSPAGLAETFAAREDDTVPDAARNPALHPLLPLRRNTSAEPDGEGRPPVFVIHPAIGLAWSFTSLLPHIPSDRQVWGVQHPALSGLPTPMSLGELATDYVARIREVSPNGPYHLVGWSVGGMIAHEMATQLTDAGHSVQALTMLDTYVLTDRPDLVAEPNVGELLAEFGVTHAAGDAPPSLTQAWQAVRGEAGPMSALSESEFARIHTAFTDASRLAQTWRPRHYPGNATFVTATCAAQPGADAVDDWHRYVDGIDELRIHCRHARMLEPDNVSHYAPTLFS